MLTVKQPVYETGWLAQATGGALRPGGLDLTKRMLALCDLSTNDRILDVGCGSAATLEYLRETGFAHVVGIDRSETLLRIGMGRSPRVSGNFSDASPSVGVDLRVDPYLRVDPDLRVDPGHTHRCAPTTEIPGGPSPNLGLACTLSHSLPFAGDQMDAILAECSLSAIASSEATLAELRRVLRPAGRLLLSDVYARAPEGIPALRALPLSCGLGGALAQADLAACLQAHGFEILTWEDHSEVLKYLTVQIIWNHGSLSQFWSQAEPGVDPVEILSAVNKAKLGYYLLIARKSP